MTFLYQNWQCFCQNVKTILVEKNCYFVAQILGNSKISRSFVTFWMNAYKQTKKLWYWWYWLHFQFFDKTRQKLEKNIFTGASPDPLIHHINLRPWSKNKLNIHCIRTRDHKKTFQLWGRRPLINPNNTEYNTTWIHAFIRGIGQDMLT